MARAPRTPKAPPIAEGAPAEPDLAPGAPAPREATTLIGHRDAAARIAASFAESPPQALLLEGPRGIGKATLAFRLAKALLSSAAPPTPDLGSDPNGRAAAQVSAGTHPSLMHITRLWDEKNKRFRADLTVEAVRRIVPFLGATAAGGAWRIVIVDAADDMNISAANALLKNLEEPPRQTLFVLIAHVAGRVLPTLRSRCRAVRLRPLSRDEVAEALTLHGANPALADASEGSVRRALLLASAGAELVDKAQRLLSPRALADPTAHLLLADEAASRRDDAFAAVVDLIFDALATRGRSGAGRLPADVLDAYAALYLEAAAERRRIEIFNLDKREYVLNLLARFAQADRAARTAA